MRSWTLAEPVPYLVNGERRKSHAFGMGRGMTRHPKLGAVERRAALSVNRREIRNLEKLRRRVARTDNSTARDSRKLGKRLRVTEGAPSLVFKGWVLGLLSASILKRNLSRSVRSPIIAAEPDAILRMVEAGGVEPPSEKRYVTKPTCLAQFSWFRLPRSE